MKAIKYNLNVYESLLDFSHGNPIEIIEIFIPELGIGINLQREFRVFKTDQSRYENARKIEELELEEKLIVSLKNLLKVKSECEHEFRKYFEIAK